MQIFAGEYSLEKVKGLHLEKKGKIYTFLQEKEYELSEFDGKNSYLSIDLPDFSFYKIEIPPVKDKSALEFILKNKLSAQIEEKIENFKLIYLKDPESSINQYVFNVFLIRKNYIDSIFSKEQLKNIELLTASLFSLVAFSNILNQNAATLHFYADSSRAILVLSKNGVVEYARYVPVPEFIFSDEDLSNFYYETLNLTFIYLKQNRNIKISNIIISGEIIKHDNFLKDAFSFTGLPICSLNYNQIISNIPVDVFNRNIIPIGNIFLDKNYDIREKEILYEKNFGKLIKYSNYILSLILVISLIFLSKNFVNYNSLKDELYKEKELLKIKTKGILEDISLSPEDINYFSNYVKFYNNAFKFNFFDFVSEIKPFLSFHKFQNLSFKKLSSNQMSINLQSKITFNSFIELNSFDTTLKKILESLKNKVKVKDNSKVDINKLTVDIDITLLKDVK